MIQDPYTTKWPPNQIWDYTREYHHLNSWTKDFKNKKLTVKPGPQQLKSKPPWNNEHSDWTMIECLESIKEVQPASSKQLVHPLKLKLLQSKNTAKQNSNIVESKWGKTSRYNLQDNTKLEVLSISPNIMETTTSFHTWIYFLVSILVSSRLEEIDRTENPCMGRRQRAAIVSLTWMVENQG